jgi:pimeloyl-ACP methyl ester carboxylesterase
VRLSKRFLLGLALLASGCAAPGSLFWSSQSRSSLSVQAPPTDARFSSEQTVAGRGGPAPVAGIIWVADGAGDFRATSAVLRQVVAEEGLPLAVHTVVWSHGYGRVLTDHVAYGAAQRQGRCLARVLQQQRQDWPAGRLYLLGHSAGCGVILSAAEALPPQTVDDIVLLAPAVSADYDLRPALRASRQGVDVFYSPRDRFCLGVLTRLAGTCDRRWGPAAGRYGFRLSCTCPEDLPLLSKLRQYPWQPSYRLLGNDGGHYGSYQPAFLRTCVLPLLWPTAVAARRCPAAAVAGGPAVHEGGSFCVKST